MTAKHRLPVPASSVRTSTRVRDQPALTTSRGLVWLLLGGILSAIALVVLVPMLALRPPGVALAGIVLVAALYLGMLLCLGVPAGRRRLNLMAWGMIGIAVVALLSSGLVAAQQWSLLA
jgi:drug/metabolite transporter (DMT)-like permease